jgi:S-DNA-T family DNA segregation ATPase FtsK/SpoIIIE
VTLRTGAGTRRLAYGRNRVADGVVVEVGSEVVVHDAGAGVVRIDGRIVRGSAGAGDGALLGTDTWAATLGVHARLRPPPAGGPSHLLPVARGEWEEHEPSPVELPAVPGRHRVPAFPWLTATVPLFMAAAAWVATGSPAMAGFMATSFVFVVAAGLEARREARAADRLAVAEFREELSLAAEALRRRREDQARRDELRHPSVDEAIDWAGLRSHRLWERSGRHPRPCEVRLGLAPAPPDDPAVGDRRGRPALRDELDAVLAHNEPADRPCTVDLAGLGGVALVGDDHLTGPLAAALVAQLAVLAPPEQVGVDLRTDPRRWRWAHWLPHVQGGAQHRVAVVERGHIDGRGGRDRAPADGQPVIWVAPDTVGLPEQVRAVVHFDAEGRATLQLGHEPAVEFQPEVVTAGALEAMARQLAGLRAAGGDRSAAPPDALDLSDIGVGVTTAAVLAQWQRRLPGLPVPIGSTGDGVLTVDLAEDGPHALVAGTTGSGKSELLRTLLAGLAALHRPDRLNVLLVDYKGGAAFGPLAELPHCVGLVTDLGPAEVDRTLAALRAELRRREQVLEDHRATDVTEMDPAVRPPSLVLAVDEFATLVAEVPEFLDGVLDVAQRGRSLGIHLVLATQRPSGVISPAVRANTSLRIALRLPDADDSVDVVGAPDAAALPRDVPGRALFRFGHDALVTAQVAHSAAPARAARAVGVRPLGAPPVDDGAVGPGPSQLAALVEATAKAAADLGIAPPRRPLPPPLPRRLPLAGLPAPSAGDRGAPVVIGLVDLPHRQRRDPLLVDPAQHGGVLVVGGPRSGRSSALVTIAAAMDRRGRVVVHGIHAGGGLAGLGGLGSVRSVMDAGDHEAVHRLLTGLLDRPPGTPTLLLVDDVGRFDELQAGVNGGRASDLLVRLAGAGRHRGVVVAVSAGRRAEVSPALVHALGLRIALRSVDADQAATMDAPAALAAADLPPGRAWVHGDWAQLALHEAPAGAPPPPGPEVLPTRVAVPEQGPGPDGSGPDGSGPWDLAIGVRADALGVARLDLGRSGAVVAGRRGTGRTTVLAAIAEAARRRGVRVLAGDDPVEVLGDLVDTARRGETGARLGLVDDLDAVVDDPRVDDLLCEAVHLTRSEDVRLVASGDPQRLLRCFSDGVTRLRSGCTGVLLGADAHLFGDLLHADPPARQDVPPAPGRGWLVGAGMATLAQCGHPGAAPERGPTA